MSKEKYLTDWERKPSSKSHDPGDFLGELRDDGWNPVRFDEGICASCNAPVTCAVMEDGKRSCMHDNMVYVACSIKTLSGGGVDVDTEVLRSFENARQHFILLRGMPGNAEFKVVEVIDDKDSVWAYERALADGRKDTYIISWCTIRASWEDSPKD